MNLSHVAKVRPRSEVVMRFIYPLARRLIQRLAVYGINPLFIVLSHGALGLLAAALIAIGGGLAFVLAALLLQLKTLLDNIDGGLARATGQVTEMGRYLDTVVDFIVNIALLAALSNYGSNVLSLLAFVWLTIILSLDFNAEHLYKSRRQEAAQSQRAPQEPPGAPLWLLELFRGIYALLFAPQDRWLRELDMRYLEQLSGQPRDQLDADTLLHWNDLFSTATLVNLGLSTQMLILGVLLLLGWPFAYVGALWLMAVYVVAVQWWRGERFKRYLTEREAKA